MDDKYINIGTIPYCEDCYNLIKRQDGKWEIFYGEYGQKVNVRIYNTEAEATEPFLKLIQRNATPNATHNSFFLVGKRKQMTGRINTGLVHKSYQQKETNNGY